MSELTVEERVKLHIGELTVSNLLLQQTVAQLQKLLAEQRGPQEVRPPATEETSAR